MMVHLGKFSASVSLLFKTVILKNFAQLNCYVSCIFTKEIVNYEYNAHIGLNNILLNQNSISFHITYQVKCHDWTYCVVFSVLLYYCLPWWIVNTSSKPFDTLNRLMRKKSIRVIGGFVSGVSNSMKQKRICETERKRRERKAKINKPLADSMTLTCSTCNRQFKEHQPVFF